MNHLDVPRVGFVLSAMRVDLTFFPLSKSIIVPTLDFDPSGILIGVGFVPPTIGQSVSGIFFEGFRLLTGSGRPACCRVFTILFWNLGIVVVSNNVFQS